MHEHLLAPIERVLDVRLDLSLHVERAASAATAVAQLHVDEPHPIGIETRDRLSGLDIAPERRAPREVTPECGGHGAGARLGRAEHDVAQRPIARDERETGRNRLGVGARRREHDSLGVGGVESEVRGDARRDFFVERVGRRQPSGGGECARYATRPRSHVGERHRVGRRGRARRTPHDGLAIHDRKAVAVARRAGARQLPVVAAHEQQFLGRERQ